MMSLETITLLEQLDVIKEAKKNQRMKKERSCGMKESGRGKKIMN
jgi:hypothetical protein